MSEQTRTILTDVQMKEIIDLIWKKAGFEDIMMLLWQHTMNDDTIFHPGKPQIQCSAWAIPKHQSEKILTAMIEAAPINARPSIGMNYINVSPSSY